MKGWRGTGTVVEESRSLGSNTLTLSYGTSDDDYVGLTRFGQVARQVWMQGTNPVDGYDYTYDAAGNRTARANLGNTALSKTQAYDGLSRLALATRTGSAQTWTLDTLGNWLTWTEKEKGS